MNEQMESSQKRKKMNTHTHTNKVEIIELKSTITKMKNSLNGLMSYFDIKVKKQSVNLRMNQ